MENEMKIYVFADFLPFQNELIGTIYVSQTRGKEFYSFEYDEQWLEKQNMVLDPDLQLYKGRQYINDDKNIFGMFADSCPDGWALSPLYDVNPDIYGEDLSLNVDENNSSIDFDLAIEACGYYGLEKQEAIEIAERMKDIVKNNWRVFAKKYRISRGEIERMQPAFQICE